jgi:hypothetical protein
MNHGLEKTASSKIQDFVSENSQRGYLLACFAVPKECLTPPLDDPF